MRELIEKMLDDPSLRHVNFDLSWSETAKYLTSTPETPERRRRDRSSAIPIAFCSAPTRSGPTNQHDYLRVLRMYDPLWKLLPPDVLDAVRKSNYERIFDSARTKVRAWEASHPKSL